MCKHKDLHLVTRPDMVTHICNPGIGEAGKLKIRTFLRLDDQPAYSGNPRTVRNSVFKTKMMAFDE